MARQSGFQGTSPAGLTAVKDSGPAPLGTERSDLLVVGVVGMMLSDALGTLQSVFDAIESAGSASHEQLTQFKTALNSAKTVAMQSQQIARLGGGRLRQSHEKLKLDELLRDALLERGKLFRQRGVELYQGLKPVEVIVDAGLLVCLVDAAIEWALSMGRKLVITLELKNWPEHGMLLIRASDGVAITQARSSDPDVAGNTLAWYLLTETASAMGVSVDRITSSAESSLMIEFPRTVKRLEGLTAVEVDTGYDTLYGDSKPMAGHRILIITNDDQIRHQVQSTARSMGLTTDFVLDSRQAVRFCEMDPPHMVIIDERVRDPVFEELAQDLRRTDGNYPFIEIASASNVLEMAGWMSDSMTRLSRDALRTQLGSILAMELAKVA
jgi:CheY-like chemotaxis protein